MNKYIQNILLKKMTRKEFLKYIGLFMLTIFGISALLKNLSNLSPTKSRKLTNKSVPKFGQGEYGV